MVSFRTARNFFNDKEWIAAGPERQGRRDLDPVQPGPAGRSASRESPIVGASRSDSGKTGTARASRSPTRPPVRPGIAGRIRPRRRALRRLRGPSPPTGYATDVMVLARSTDDGRTSQRSSSPGSSTTSTATRSSTGGQTLTDEHFRLNSYPSMSDRPVTGQSPSRGPTTRAPATVAPGDVVHRHHLEPGEAGLRHLGRLRITAPRHSPPVQRTRSSRPSRPPMARSLWAYYTRDYAISSTAATCHFTTNDARRRQCHAVTAANSVCMDYAAKANSDSFAAQIGAFPPRAPTRTSSSRTDHSSAITPR